MGKVLTGLESFLAGDCAGQFGPRVCLITNQTGVDRRLRSTVELLRDRVGGDLVALFGPEHGVRGDAQAGEKVDQRVDRRSGLPVHSLYGDVRAPSREMLRELDALIFDVQDVGTRYATYLSTMLKAQRAVAEEGLDFVVFDRPNPITGVCVEGNRLDPAFVSFVGIYPVLIRHGMTVGEFALMVAREQGWLDPIVVPMQGWRREHWFDETDLPWVQPSPNLPTLDSVTLYPGTCLVEGTNLSEGRGTTRPFEVVGAPWLDPFRLAAELESRQLPGVLFRPTFFTPSFSKHSLVSCGGIQIHIVDRAQLRPVELGIHLLHVARTLDSESFSWHEQDGTFFIDRLLGTDRPRRMLEQGAEPREIVADWEHDAQEFEERRAPFLLYQ